MGEGRVEQVETEGVESSTSSLTRVNTLSSLPGLPPTDDFAEEEEVHSFGYKRFGKFQQSSVPSLCCIWEMVM